MPRPPAAPAPPLPRLFRCVLPWLRREWPMWGRLYALAGGNDARRFADMGVRNVVGKLHGYVMPLDLANWSERLSWSLARYHDLPLQLALQHVLRPGDCFVDIGANIGMVTLLARHLVGPSGHVMACEPNPRLRARLEDLVALNRLAGVELVAKALGEAPGTAELREFAGHTGWGSLAARGPDGAATTAVWQVPVVRGDDLLAAAPAGPMVVKIDVEGFEVPVLRGLQTTLAKRAPAVLVEVADAHQRRAGHSAAALRGELERLGYRGYELRTQRRLGFARRLQLVPLAAEVHGEIDALFLPQDGPLAARGLG
ncbi:MAG: FkbM family methyltransferase [Planctomycetes bacterium]|nr:FkbM family methyltransferase [Planctomycetota bacterium]